VSHSVSARSPGPEETETGACNCGSWHSRLDLPSPVYASGHLVTSAAQRLKVKARTAVSATERTQDYCWSSLDPSVAPLECDVLQLATALNLQHNRLSWSHRLKQRPELLNRFDRLLVDLVNDVPRAQVRCVSV
jgi:hypothetical protein